MCKKRAPFSLYFYIFVSFFKENVRYPERTCRDPISDSRDSMIIFSDSRDPIFSDSRDSMIIFSDSRDPKSGP